MSDQQPVNPELSGFRFYSVGRAANNKALKNDKGEPELQLEVTPIEQLNMLDGELISLPFDSETTGEHADGTPYNVKVKLNTAITATWLGLDGNRRTPPDIRRGERVIIWRYKDHDQFYWTETGWDNHLRRLETVHYRWSSTPDEKADMGDPKNWYHLQISTHEGMIHLETTRENGEAAKYALQINTKDGMVVMSDDFGNFFQLESVAKIWSMQNGDGTLWQLDKKKIYGYAPDIMHVIAENTIHFKTTDFLLECATGNIDATSSFKVKTPKFEVDSPESKFTGNVEIDKELTVKGKSKFQDMMQAKGIQSPEPITGPAGSI